MPNQCSWSVDEDTFIAIELLRLGKPCRYVLWNLWSERNKRAFDGVQHPSFVIIDSILQLPIKKNNSILQSLYDWIQAVGGIPLMSFVDFIDSLFVICILGKGTAHIYFVSFPFPFSIKLSLHAYW